MKNTLAIIFGAALIAASIGFIGRYQIAATGTDSKTVYRLDRWTGSVDVCPEEGVFADVGGACVTRDPRLGTPTPPQGTPETGAR
jgi:hypothetical protein